MDILIYILLGLTSVIGLAIIGERSFALRWSRVVPTEIATALASCRTRGDVQMLARVCEKKPSPLGRLLLMAADLPVSSIHRQVASALDLIVHISRMPGGHRVVTQISEVTRIDPETKQIVVLDIFNFRDGQTLQPTGYLPSFVDLLMEKGRLYLDFLYGREPPLAGAVPTAPPAANLLGRQGLLPP